MRPEGKAALVGLPVGGRWDFGGFAYGLEPLVLPSAGWPDADHDEPAGKGATDGYAETCRRLHALGEGSGRAPEVEPCGAPDELFWFRWITGHQVCFILWRLIGQLLDDVNQSRRSPAEALEPISRYVDGYSAMLLYTGSCPRETYRVVIRPSMRLRHRAFSGSWAPDYWPIRDLFRGRQPAVLRGADTGQLLDAMTLQHLVHDGVAARLVTEGKSLLSEASVRGTNHRTAAMIYDSYFMTLRSPIARPDVVTQLLRRLVATTQDLAANGLYADEFSDEWPADLRTAEVVKCENSLADILLEVARCACELTPAEVVSA